MAVTQILILLLELEESTLGQRMKPVYLHVSLTWTGMLLFRLTAILGLDLVFLGKEKLALWLIVV
jgi:hypothetical protein